MLRTLLPLSLLIAGMPAQAGVPAPAGRVLVPSPPSSEVFAKTEWLVPGPVAEPKWTLFVCTTAALLRAQRGGLEDLQHRFGERGARIAVVLPRDEAKVLAAQKPPFAVGTLDDDAGLKWTTTGTCWLAVGMHTLLFAAVDGAADVLAAMADGKYVAPLLLALQQLESLLGNVGDGSDLRAQATHLATLLPHSGRARALPVLVEWWGTGDLDAARRQFDAGMKVLAMDTVALALFVNAKVQQAIEMQIAALAASPNDPRYAVRLRRYQNTLARRTAKGDGR